MIAMTRICFAIPAILLLGGALGTGCGRSNEPTSTQRDTQRKSFTPQSPQVNRGGEGPEAPNEAEPRGGREPAQGQKDANKASPPAVRKVIQTSTVSMVVKELDAAKQQLNRLIDDNGAYISKSEFSGNRGTRRTANWTIRVPAEKFAGFVDTVLTLGIPEHQTSDAQDVTEEFVDVEARLKNLKAEEETLNRLMKELAKSNADLLAFREQIRTLREKIEQAEARFEKLTGLTSLSTLYLTMQEEKDYVPPSAPAKPSLGGRVGEAFEGSITLLSQFGEMLLIGAVAVAPWLPLLVLVSGCFWLFRRESPAPSRPVVETPAPLPTDEPTEPNEPKP